MIPAISLEVDLGELVQATDRYVGALDPVNVVRMFGDAVYKAVRDNLALLDVFAPNQMGGERTHWYAQAAESTILKLDGDVALISVTQPGAALRYYGGVVKAGAGESCVTGQPTRFLTIPATAEAYGKRACDVGPLKVLYGRNGPYALATASSSPEERSAAGYDGNERGFGAEVSTIMFWLKEEVTIPEDPRMLPTVDSLYDSIGQAWGDYLDQAEAGATIHA